MPLILSTKKFTPVQRQFLLDAQLQVLDFDFINIELMPFQVPHPLPDRLIFTSQNAVQSVLLHADFQLLKQIPAFCVGTKTASLLTRNGWRVEAEKPYATELAKLIVEQYRSFRFVFFTGNIRSNIIPDMFDNQNIAFQEIETYRTTLVAHKVEVRPDAVLFFSPSGVESYTQLNSITTEQLFCIGNVTAEVALRYSQNVITSSSPTVENVITSCLKFFRSCLR